MDWIIAYLSRTESLMTAMAALVGAVAWPLTVFLLAYLFRKQIQDALSALRHVEAPGGFKADFHATLAHARETVADLEPSAEAQATSPGPGSAPVAPASPQGADEVSAPPAVPDPSEMILSAWRRLRKDLLEYASLGGVRLPDPTNPALDLRWILIEMKHLGLLSEEATSGLFDLRELRNAVVSRQHVPTFEEAGTYSNTAYGFQLLIREQRDAYLKRHPHAEPQG
ncbi:hypothetical protein ITJ42_16020 [Clavibacter michiganensis subsp. phaseoli]|uniref:Uncharacterized protein n=1 Tax=Clavibacter phaseoli TaxID=1734031 RepID=A0A8I0SLD2_9MICO|nr:hypothetical protein [Clavibacter phaseoli]MBF4632727.1 hypothetical protein [Clavibacter phaseoli]